MMCRKCEPFLLNVRDQRPDPHSVGWLVAFIFLDSCIGVSGTHVSGDRIRNREGARRALRNKRCFSVYEYD